MRAASTALQGRERSTIWCSSLSLKPERFPAAAVRWHGRLELESPTLTMAESQFALGALAMLGEGRREAVDVLRALLREVRPTLVPRLC